MPIQRLFDRLALRASHKALRQYEGQANYRFLRQIPLFQEFSAPAFVYLYDHLMERTYKRQESVFKEGNPGICLFIVRQGRVELYAAGESGDPAAHTVFTVVGEGAVFGELSLTSVPYRTSSARALDHGTILLALSTYDLQTLCQQWPADGMALARGLNSTMATHLLSVDRALCAARREIEELKRKHPA